MVWGLMFNTTFQNLVTVCRMTGVRSTKKSEPAILQDKEII